MSTDMHRFHSTKTYGHDVGLSCTFRQWRADSHCNQLHGYALAVKFDWSAQELDKRGWVVDFGGLNVIKEFLKENFDHTLAIALDDPAFTQFELLRNAGAAAIRRFHDGVGCEKFSKFIFEWVETWTMQNYGPRVRLEAVTVSEHGGNSATYSRSHD